MRCACCDRILLETEMTWNEKTYGHEFCAEKGYICVKCQPKETETWANLGDMMGMPVEEQEQIDRVIEESFRLGID